MSECHYKQLKRQRLQVTFSCHRSLHPRHYYLAFFDILYHNGRSLLDTPYNVRRSILQQAIRCIPGFVSDYASDYGVKIELIRAVLPDTISRTSSS